MGEQLFNDEELVKIALKNLHKLPYYLRQEVQRFIIRAVEEAETKGE